MVQVVSQLPVELTVCQLLLDYFALRVEKEGKKRDEVKWEKIKVRKRNGRKKLEQVKGKK
jgi:hypothetical protein